MSQRPTASDSLYTQTDKFIVVLDSRNATSYLNGTMNSSVAFDFAEPIYIAKDSLQFTASVLSFVAPNSIYNVNATNNVLDLMYLSSTSQGVLLSNPVHVVIPTGNYNANTFITTVTSLVTQVDSIFGAGFGMSLNSINNKFTLTHATNLFHIMPSSTTYQVMGFDKNTEIICALGSTTKYAIYCNYTCNFNGLQNLNVHFDSVVTSNLDSFNKSNSPIIQSIPIDPNSAQISFIKTTDYNCTIRQDVIDVIVISLRDDLEQFVDFNNQHWNMTLYFSCIKDIDRFAHEQDFRRILQFGYNR